MKRNKNLYIRKNSELEKQVVYIEKNKGILEYFYKLDKNNEWQNIKKAFTKSKNINDIVKLQKYLVKSGFKKVEINFIISPKKEDYEKEKKLKKYFGKDYKKILKELKQMDQHMNQLNNKKLRKRKNKNKLILNQIKE